MGSYFLRYGVVVDDGNLVRARLTGHLGHLRVLQCVAAGSASLILYSSRNRMICEDEMRVREATRSWNSRSLDLRYI